MFFNAAFLVLVLAISDVFGISVLQLRSLEIRQNGNGGMGSMGGNGGNDGNGNLPNPAACPGCTDISNYVATCKTLSCVCNPPVAGDIQACIDCALGYSGSSSDVVSQSVNLVNAFQNLCKGVPSLPTITFVPAAGNVSITASPGLSTISSVIVVPKPLNTTMPPSGAVIPSSITRTALGGGTTPAAGGVPGTSIIPETIKNGCRRGRQAGLVFVGAFVGGVLAF